MYLHDPEFKTDHVNRHSFGTNYCSVTTNAVINGIITGLFQCGF